MILTSSRRQIVIHARDIYDVISSKHSTAYWGSHRGCLYNLGIFYRNNNDRILGLPDYKAAHDAFSKALTFAERMRNLFHSHRNRKMILRESSDIYSYFTLTSVDLWRLNQDQELLEKAVEASEAGRSRQLTELVRGEFLLPSNITDRQQLISEFLEVRKTLKQAFAKLEFTIPLLCSGECGFCTSHYGVKGLAIPGRRTPSHPTAARSEILRKNYGLSKLNMIITSKKSRISIRISTRISRFGQLHLKKFRNQFRLTSPQLSSSFRSTPKVVWPLLSLKTV